MRKFIACLAVVVVGLAGCQDKPNSEPSPSASTIVIPEPSITMPEGTIEPSPAPSERSCIVRATDYLSSLRCNEEFRQVSDEVLEQSGNQVCTMLRDGRKVEEVLAQLTGPQDMPPNLAATLVFSSVKFKCPEQTGKVRAEIAQ